MSKTNTRINWVDVAKGIAILLVIVGHTFSTRDLKPQIIRGMIFSFHMPLFFMLSIYTFRPSTSFQQWIQKTKGAAKHLLIPLIINFSLLTVYAIIKYPLNYPDYFIDRLYTLLYSSGVVTVLSNRTVSQLGMMWFLVVLFLSRTLYDLLQLKTNTMIKWGICWILSILGVFIGRRMHLPFSFDIVLAILPFLAVGDYFKTYLSSIDSKTWTKLLLSFLTWIFLLGIIYYFSFAYLELAVRRYPLYPICYICAVAGTLFIVYFSYILDQKFNIPLLTTIGRESLLLFSIHVLDFTFRDIWAVSTNIYLNLIVRIIVDLSIFFILKYIKELISTHRKQA